MSADYRRTVTWKYICRGFLVIFSYAPPLLFIALGSFGALELFNLYKQGEIQRLWLVAMETELTFDLVGACSPSPGDLMTSILTFSLSGCSIMACIFECITDLNQHVVLPGHRRVLHQPCACRNVGVLHAAGSPSLHGGLPSVQATGQVREDDQT